MIFNNTSIPKFPTLVNYSYNNLLPHFYPPGGPAIEHGRHEGCNPYDVLQRRGQQGFIGFHQSTGTGILSINMSTYLVIILIPPTVALASEMLSRILIIENKN